MRTKNLINRWLFLSGVISITVVLSISLSSRPAQAIGFSFEGSDAGGTGSGMLIFDDSVLGTDTIIVDIINTSPILLDDGTASNGPGITGFGFDIGEDPLPTLLSWTFEAYDQDGNLVRIDDQVGGTGDWELTVDGNVSGIRLDYFPHTDTGILGALYNPDCGADPTCVNALAADPNYFTTAILKLNLDSNVNPDFTAADSPTLRMQNVGENGEGSLKLPGTPKLPLPSTLLLLGAGLLGLSWAQRRT